MRAILTVVFLFLVIGAGVAVFEADDSTERRINAAVALVGMVGLWVMARSLRRKLGDAEYARVTGFSPELTIGIAKFVGLTVALPAVLYWIITGHLSVNDGGNGLLATALAVGGLILWMLSMRL